MVKNYIKKAQSLPLNTIVIAILVIVVLVVIITFFVSNTAKTGESLEQNSVTGCSLTNPALKTVGYTEVKVGSEVTEEDINNNNNYGCKNGLKVIDIIPRKEIKNGDEVKYQYCCGK